MHLVPRQTPSSAPEPYVVPPSQEFEGNDGSWSTFKINVGTPGQDFRVLPSTKSGVTYVIAPEGCQAESDPDDCPNRRGVGVFNSKQNSGFQVNASDTWSLLGEYDVNLESALGYESGGLFGFDKVALGPAADSTSLSLGRQVVAGVADMPYFLGNLPLGIPASSFSSSGQAIESFMHQLRNNTKIPSMSFGYTAGAKYRLKSVFGNLILGGWDSTRLKPNDDPFTFTFSTDPSKLLTVGVASILATNTLKGTYSLSGDAHWSVIDSTVPHLWLPKDVCDDFEQAFGLSYDSKTDLYLVNDTIHEELKSLNPIVTIKLANSLEDTSRNYTNIQLPYAAFDLEASYPYYNNSTKYFPIRRAANDTQYTLGRTLLQEAYLIVDYERANFTVAQAAFPDPLPAANIVTIEPPSQSESSRSFDPADPSQSSKQSGLSTGAIVGIAIGIVLLLIILAAGAFLLFKQRRTKKNQYELANTQVHGSEQYPGSTAAHKTQFTPQELSGTPLSELVSPHSPQYPYDMKPVLNDVPQELPVPMAAVVSQKFREVHSGSPISRFHEMDGTSSLAPSQNHSRAPSSDGIATGNGPLSTVSPLNTGRF